MMLNFTFLALCLATGTLSFTVENGNATRFYSTGQPPSCNPGNTDPALTVSISPVFNLTSLCETWMVITNTGGGKNGDDAGNNTVRATVTGICSTCAKSDLLLGSTWYNGLLVNESASEVRPQPTEFGIQWYFCDGKREC